MKTWIFPSDPTVAHATGPLGGDLTLCGDALEGEDGDDEAFERAGRVSCPRCLAIIAHCRKMPGNYRASKEL